MNDRLSSARRVLDMQVKLRRIAELKLVELRRQELVLRTEEEELSRFLGGESPFLGAFVKHYATASEEQPEVK